MNKRLLFALFAVAMLFNLPSISMAQVLKPDLLFCGSNSRFGSDLYLGIGPFNEVSGCVPGVDTQALLITRSGTVGGNGAAWLAYLNSGGVIITEYSITDDVYNEIYGTGYGQGTNFGSCSDNTMPSLKLSPDHPFWQLNSGLTETPAGQEGCGWDLSAIATGEAEVTELGGLVGTPFVSFAIRPQGSGVFWLLEADWQDNESSYTDTSKNFMGALISGGAYSISAGDSQPIPTLSTLGLLLLVLAFVYLGRRRIKV
ncbi:MAG: hypothetical protein WBN06_16935 [Lysobacterales bacterium]